MKHSSKGFVFAVLMVCFASSAQAQVKNAQDLLGGLLTRAGVKGQKPLSHADLVQLCEQGYTEAYFLYGGAKTQVVHCSKGSIEYSSSGDFRQPGNLNKILDNVAEGLRSRERTFVHCNNGAHASGFVGAIALRTFCGISGERAVQYWDATLSGYPLQEPNRSKLMKRIRDYKPRADLELNEGQKSALGCDRFR